MFFQNFIHLLGIHRLCKKILEALGFVFFRRPAEHIGRKGDNDRFIPVGKLSDSLQRLYPVHPRHHMIQKYDIILFRHKRVNCFHPAGNSRNGYPIGTQDPGRYRPIHLIIIHHQRFRALCRNGHAERLYRKTPPLIFNMSDTAPVLYLTNNTIGKCRSFPVNAFHTDLAAHHFNYASADGKSQPGSFYSPVAFRIHLGETGEYFIKILFFDTYARISDFSKQPASHFIQRLAGHLPCYTAPGCKFHCVAQQVDQHLFQAHFIRINNRRKIFVYVQLQIHRPSLQPELYHRRYIINE